MFRGFCQRLTTLTIILLMALSGPAREAWCWSPIPTATTTAQPGASRLAEDALMLPLRAFLQDAFNRVTASQFVRWLKNRFPRSSTPPPEELQKSAEPAAVVLTAEEEVRDAHVVSVSAMDYLTAFVAIGLTQEMSIFREDQSGHLIEVPRLTEAEDFVKTHPHALVVFRATLPKVSDFIGTLTQDGDEDGTNEKFVERMLNTRLAEFFANVKTLTPVVIIERSPESWSSDAEAGLRHRMSGVREFVDTLEKAQAALTPEESAMSSHLDLAELLAEIERHVKPLAPSTADSFSPDTVMAKMSTLYGRAILKRDRAAEELPAVASESPETVLQALLREKPTIQVGQAKPPFFLSAYDRVILVGTALVSMKVSSRLEQQYPWRFEVEVLFSHPNLPFPLFEGFQIVLRDIKSGQAFRAPIESTRIDEPERAVFSHRILGQELEMTVERRPRSSGGTVPLAHVLMIFALVPKFWAGPSHFSSPALRHAA